jgi:hypothetical protein
VIGEAVWSIAAIINCKTFTKGLERIVRFKLNKKVKNVVT